MCACVAQVLSKDTTWVQNIRAASGQQNDPDTTNQTSGIERDAAVTSI
jgi:hypothetical protein